MKYLDWVQVMYDIQFGILFSERFATSMIETYQRADFLNKRKIEKLYPELGEAFRNWEQSGDYGIDLFRTHKIGRFKNE